MTKDAKYGLPPESVEKLCSVFLSHPQIEKVVLYGSRALGTYRESSDIDLTVVGTNADLTLLLELENEIDDLLLPYKVDISLMSKIDNPNLIDHINRVGIPFFQRYAVPI